MRRKDREQDQAFALNVIDKCEYAVLATTNEDHTPYCIPVTIVRNGDCIYFHCASSGQKIGNMRRSPQVCMTCVGDTQIQAEEFTTKYESAVVRGAASEVTNEPEKIEALRLLCQRHVPTNMENFDSELARSLARTAVWKISIEALTGKAKK